MNPTVTKTVVSLMGHDNSEAAAQKGAVVPLKLRLKTEQQATELKSALDRELEFVKAKSAD